MATPPTLIPAATVEMRGHLIDSLLLTKVIDLIEASSGHYTLNDIQIGQQKSDLSYANLTVTANDTHTLEAILALIAPHGAKPPTYEEALLTPCPADGVYPEGFYSTTNLPTEVLYQGQWIPVDRQGMDAAIVVDPATRTARVEKFSGVKAGDLVVVDHQGVKVKPLAEILGTADSAEKGGFQFMNSEVSSEKPKSIVIQRIAEKMRRLKAHPAGPESGKIVFVAGPALVHTDAREAMCRLIEAGYVDYLFAGNALATHDLEAAIYGTSLGVRLTDGAIIPGGHAHHVRTINKIRAAGSIANAVEQGIVTNGIMRACVQHGTDFVLAGSIRDDGPLPDVVTNIIDAQKMMRNKIHDNVKLCVMLSTMLHSIAVGNLLPASVETICVDINPAVVTKLADRGTAQSIPLVTDVEGFLRELARLLVD